jgi:DNA-binding transcriptional ArsR family regulator
MGYEYALDALGDPTRRAIVAQLRQGPRPVGEIARALPVSRPAVSRHLRVLERAQIVAHEARGTRNLYRIDARGLARARDWIDGMWESALERFAQHVEGADDERSTA